MEIKKTKNYEMFGGVVGNRKLSNTHMARLSKSILTNNLLAISPIIVNSKMQIIDGQHRLEIAKNNNLDVYYIVVKDGDLNTVLTLNINRQNWSAQDYLDSYVSLGNPEYIYLEGFIKQYELTNVSVAIEILSGQNRWGTAWSNFKAGTFVADNKKEGEQFAISLLYIKPYAQSRARNDREFLRALRQMLEVASVEQLAERLTLSGREIEAESTVKDYLRQFEDILNYRKSKDIVRLY